LQITLERYELLENVQRFSLFENVFYSGNSQNCPSNACSQTHYNAAEDECFFYQ